MSARLFGGALAVAALLSAPAWAQTAPTPVPAPAAASTRPPIDPARLAAAEPVVAALVPQGVYQRLMGDSFGKLMEASMGAAGDMPLEQLMRFTGMPEEDLAKIGEGTANELLEIFDPNWRARMRSTSAAMSTVMTRVGTTMEPLIRKALARAYAREFSVAELQEMARFFATPAGAHYAGKSLEIAMDPEMVQAITEAMPAIMAEMPAVMTAMQGADKELPEPRKYKDLSLQEQKRVAELLGVDPAELEADAEKLETL